MADSDWLNAEYPMMEVFNRRAMAQISADESRRLQVAIKEVLASPTFSVHRARLVPREFLKESKYFGVEVTMPEFDDVTFQFEEITDG